MDNGARSEKKHILVISQYFYPEQFRINDMCVEWVSRGYKVTVVTGIPNYPEGKFYPGYGITKKRKEVWNGIDIIRLPLTARGKGKLGMVANYFSFVISGFFWKLTSKIKPDCIFTFEVSPMTQALLGVWYSKKRRIPNYLYVQDLWPENIEIIGGIHNKFILRSISKMVNYIYAGCDRIFATSPSFVEEIQKRCDDPSKVTYWPQYAEEFYRPMQIDEDAHEFDSISADASFKIAFTGNIGQAQGLDILPKSASILKKQGANVKFIIVGDGRSREAFEKSIEEHGVSDMFVMMGRYPAEKIPQILSCCDSAFLSFMDNELFAKTIPAKLQSYMACGMPMIASAMGETERIINEACCGVCSPIGDEQALADAVTSMLQKTREELQEMSRSSLEYAGKNFSKGKLMDEMDSYLGIDN